MAPFAASARLLVVGMLLLALATCAYPFDKAYEKAGGSGEQQVDVGAKSATKVCPDLSNTRLYNLDTNKNWVPTPCEAVVVRAAIDYCIKKTIKTDDTENVVERVEDVTNGLNAVVATGVGAAGLATGSLPVAVTGGATLFGTMTGDIGKIFTGTPPQTPATTSMFNAASSYVEANQDLVVPQDKQGYNNPFYAGLWNAVGSSCPSNLLAGSFKLAKIPKPVDADPAEYWSAQRSVTASYSLTGTDKVADVVSNLAKQLTALLPPPDFSVKTSGASITVNPPQSDTVGGFTLTSAVTSAQHEIAAVDPGATPGPVKIQIALIAPAQKDTIGLTVTWYVKRAAALPPPK